MEIAGVEKHKKDVSERLEVMKNAKERLKSWIWKGAQLAGLVTGDNQHGFKGEKFENHIIKVSWRKSKQCLEDESKREQLLANYPDIYDYEIRCTREGGLMLNDLILAGMIEIKNVRFSRSRAEEQFKKMPIDGITIKHKINPQIK